jgi:hypothetical protein
MIEDRRAVLSLSEVKLPTQLAIDTLNLPKLSQRDIFYINSEILLTQPPNPEQPHY